MLAVAGIVVAVPGQRLTSTPSIWEQRQCSRALPRQQHEASEIANAIHQGDDLGCQTAA